MSDSYTFALEEQRLRERREAAEELADFLFDAAESRLIEEYRERRDSSD